MQAPTARPRKRPNQLLASLCRQASEDEHKEALQSEKHVRAPMWWHATSELQGSLPKQAADAAQGADLLQLCTKLIVFLITWTERA